MHMWAGLVLRAQDPSNARRHLSQLVFDALEGGSGGHLVPCPEVPQCFSPTLTF